jgi:alkanesulfonate monooxygenase SsuD/methylene tetrahydromethanopterin reductase-like flavin-dependent oxidoreductase (luciferase family)
MEIGIGLPNAVPGATGPGLIEWARRAETAGFSTLTSIGAVSYPRYEELTVLGAAAAVTERIRLMTNVLIAPARSAAELAKQAATVDALSGGRLTLGFGVGWRQPDFALTGRDFEKRGSLFDQLLRELVTAWSGQAIAADTRPPAPTPTQNPIPILIGGTNAAAVRRVIEHGVGWTAGGMPPDVVADFSRQVRTAWSDAGREGSPRISALVYFGLGETEEQSRHSIRDYYEPMGDQVANMIADNVLRSPEAIRGAMQAYQEAGADLIAFSPTVPDPAQVELLAEVALG